MMSGNPFTECYFSFICALDSFILPVMCGCSLQSRFRIRCRSEIKSFAVGLQL